MARFKPGQQVVCVSKFDSWIHLTDGREAIMHPKFNNTYTIDYYTGEYDKCWGYGVVLKEIPIPDHSFGENNFAPLMDITELTEVLNAEPIAN